MAFLRVSALWLPFLVAGCGTAGGTGDGSTLDASGGADSSTAGDVGSDAAHANDSSLDSGASCDGSRVTFVPSSGHLAVGQLCDDVFVCPIDAADAARIAAIGFECSVTTEGPCTSSMTCRLRPSTLDAAEVQEICDVVTVSTPPQVTCMVYL